jgi:S-adenosylmethionine decarboxylase
MFNDSILAGKHLISDLYYIKNTSLLNDCEGLKSLCRDICLKFNFSILGELDYIFTPQGLSFIFLLSESHLSIHTYPERNHISFDLYTCREYENDDSYNNIIKLLKDSLECDDNSLILNRKFQ